MLRLRDPRLESARAIEDYCFFSAEGSLVVMRSFLRR